MSLEFEKVKHNNKLYGVMNISYKDIDLPVIIDWCDLNVLKDLDKNWKSNKYGFISCSHTYDDNTKDIFLHEIIMALRVKDGECTKYKKPVVHINRIGLDNRRVNLIYDNVNKKIKKNIKKKKRIVILPNKCGINPNDIPTYVWYMKPNGSHGDRFIVKIGNINWKTTSSKKVSLKYKLEEAKKYLRQLKTKRPELFENYCMNGEYTKQGKKLLSSFYNIVEKAGYDYIKRYIPENRTELYLKPGNLSFNEKKLLKSQGNLLRTSNNRRRLLENLPLDSGINVDQIPDHCYYRPPYGNRGDYFIVKNHPLQKTVWRSTCSNKIHILDKYNEMIDYLDSLCSGGI